MALKRIAFLTFLLWLVLPDTAFGQIPEWLSVSPPEIYQAPGYPSCYTITVGGGAYMTVNLEYYYEGGGPYYVYGWPSLDGNGQAEICADSSVPAGFYQFTGIQNSQYPYFFTPIYATLTVYPAPAPVIYGLGPGCANWDCIWVGGANFQLDSYVFVYSDDWSTYQIFWGPAWGRSPEMWMDIPYLMFQITNPALLSSFGTYGVHVLVANPGGGTSNWVWTRSGPPVISSGAAGCADGYCITLIGAFPLDAVVDFRVPGQPDVIPNAYSDLSVSATTISLRLNPGVRHDFDVSGFNAWVVNPPLSNWSDGYYISAVDKNITGKIEGIALSGVQYYINGWACAKTFEASVDVWIYVGGPAGTGAWLGSGTANLNSEPGVAAACNSTGSHYRFSVPIPDTITQDHRGQAIFVHGISPFGLPNSLLDNSGNLTIPGNAVVTLSWNQDYIRDEGGVAIAIARPAPLDATPPSVPTVLTVTSSTATSVSLSWSASSSWGGASKWGYRIYRQWDSGPSLPIGAVTTTTFQDTTVQSGQTYTYTVVAVNTAEVYSSTSPSSQVTTP